MVFQRNKQRISATEVLKAIAGGSDIELHDCTISGALDVNRFFEKSENFEITNLAVEQANGKKTITLSQSIVFNRCTFEENVSFAPPWSEPDSLAVVFKKDVIFNSSNFARQSLFRNAVFCGLAGFDGCKFSGIASYRNATFGAAAMFRTTAFEGYGLFSGAVFGGDVRFCNTHFRRGVNFMNVKFKGKTDFAGVHSASKLVPVYESVSFSRHSYGDDETFWRFIKQAAQEAGHYRLAGESFYSERCAQLWRKFRGANYDVASPLKKLGRCILGLRLLPELVFGRLLFGYGERPVRILAASAFIIILCALFYSQYGVLLYRGQLNPIQQSFLDGLYFSTITFTTVGFGDFYPHSEHFTRCVAMAEALAGAILIALFVVSLAKRFSRG